MSRALPCLRAGFSHIAESGGQKIRTWNPATGLIATVVGSGVYGYSPDGTAALSATLANPGSPAFDSSGALNFIDGLRVRKILNGSLVTVAGNGAFASTGDGGPPLSASLLGPTFVTFDTDGNLYLAEPNDNKIRKVGGGVISTFLGNAPNGDGAAAAGSDLLYPYTVGMDPNGNLYIVDTFGQRIRKVAAGSGMITTFAGNGVAGYSGDGGPASSAQISYPWGIACDSAGNVYIGDGARIRKVTAATGIITTIGGTGAGGASGDGGPATAATFGYQLELAVDGAGNIYVSDINANRVRKIAAATGIVTAFAGTGAAGFSGDGGPAVSATLNSVPGIAVDAAGNVYLGDGNNYRLRKVDAVTGIITTIAGLGVWGDAGDLGPASQAQLPYMSGVAVDALGNIYIGENSARVRKISAAGIIDTIAGTGVPGYSGDGGQALQAELDFPAGLAVSGSGIVYFADSGNGRVRALTPPAGAPAVLSIVKSHSGSFSLGQPAATYTLSVSNGSSAGPTNGTPVTVTENMPAGLALVSMTGTGWTCPGTTANNCTRSDVLAAGASYPPITMTAEVTASGTVTNQASVSGGGSVTADAADPASITGSVCDVNQTGNLAISDVQSVINESLGKAPAVHDLNHDGAVNVTDVQIVTGWVLGKGCSGS